MRQRWKHFAAAGFACALLFWTLRTVDDGAGQAATLDPPGALASVTESSNDPVGAVRSAESPLLEDLQGPEGQTAHEVRTAAPVLAEEQQHASVDLRVLHALSPRPARFVAVFLLDKEGTQFSEVTDRDGRIRSSVKLAIGPVEVLAYRDYAKNPSGSPREVREVKSVIDFSPEPGVPLVIDVSLPRLVPVRVTATDERGGPATLSESELAACGFWWASPPADPSPSIQSELSSALAGIADEVRAGATHFLRAEGPDPARVLAATCIREGLLHYAALGVSDLPDIGDPPIELTLVPYPLELLPARIQSNYSWELKFAAWDRADRAIEAERPKRSLHIIVRSQSGPMTGKVGLRASPVGSAPDGEPAYRKQWLDADWRINENGEVVADVLFEDLDATDYSIRAVPETGVSIIDPVQAVDLIAAEHNTIEFLAHR